MAGDRPNDLDLTTNTYWVRNGKVFYYNTLPDPMYDLTLRAKAIARCFGRKPKGK